MDQNTYQCDLGGKKLTFNTRKLAEQANGAVFVQYGETLVLATAVMSKEERNAGFFPLTVEYEERFYAAGKILGSRYLRRENRPSDEAILTARLIDRAIRPRFPKDFFKEVQSVITCLSWDRQNDPDVVGLNAASLALSISDIPFAGPVAALRVGRADGKFILNPSYEERKNGDLDLVLAGLEERGELLINMIESEARQVSEEVIIEAYSFAKPHLKEILDFQNQVIKKEGKKKMELILPEKDAELEKEIKGFLGQKLENALYEKDKASRNISLDILNQELYAFLEDKYQDGKKIPYAKNFIEKETDRIIHDNLLKNGKRPDGRGMEQIRDINCEVGLIPRTHGSGLFMRGQTKILSILTLGAPSDVKLLEGMEEANGKKRFMHHYNFPPYSSGEIKPMRGPGRREIGHGMLAEKALIHLIPSFEEFPYTIRIVSETLSSNGSTSMASVSAASLALMDAGVPIKGPATGISIGVVMDPNDFSNYKLMTDIQGPEDHHGGMDFKVAGTREGITAIQMDVKIAGITEEVFKNALEKAKKARYEILDTIEKTLSEPRKELSPLAPRIMVLNINPDKIRDVIGPGGKIINEIIAKTGAAIDIEQTGVVFITGDKEEAALKAIDWIKNLTREAQVGETFQGKVTRVFSFGAMVELFPGQEGLIHISQLAPHRVNRVEDVVNIGDTVEVKVTGIDEQGRVNLTLKSIQEKSKTVVRPSFRPRRR